ncbi:flippase [Oribacterium sp. WCC10]|uniref:flippase n=1 Tax=Oribacterium sp. WCC10 TaxID=1855343 RepID=UPI0008F261D2|nr:flippase [Oribacterium sp. WCC10]SFG80523.1 Membrane protein involved in the export of O-antigen and teichoic acid [Oribacterium sp. WCC10]
MNSKSLSKNVLYNIIYKVLNVVFPLVSTAYISRVLLAEGVGRFAAVNNNVSYFLILATLGIPVYGLREIAKLRENYIERSRLYSELFILNFILSIVSYILFISIIIINHYFKKELRLYFIMGLTILLNILNVDWLFQGLEEYGYIAARSVMIKLVSLFTLFILVRNKDDIYIYAIIQVIAASGNYLCNIIKSRELVKFSIHDIRLKLHIKPLAYLALCSISTELYAKMDISMLDIMKSSDVVGYYTSSQKIINLIVTTMVAVTAVFMPRLSYLYDKDKNEFNRILKIGFDLMVTISIPSFCGLIVVSRPLVLSFLGKDFLPAAKTISILSVMVPLKCVGDMICFQVMMCARKEILLMKSYFITMLVNLVNNLLLIPRFGAEGASIASVVSEILAFGFVLFFSRRFFYIENINTTLLKTVICTFITVCSISPFYYINCSCYMKLFIEVFVGSLVYLFACLLIKHEVVLYYVHAIRSRIKK